MEFSLFVHMERTNDRQSHAELYEEFIALCQMADAGGMRAIWTGEHHAMNFTIAPKSPAALIPTNMNASCRAMTPDKIDTNSGRLAKLCASSGTGTTPMTESFSNSRRQPPRRSPCRTTARLYGLRRATPIAMNLLLKMTAMSRLPPSGTATRKSKA